jgi:F-type H+-transporting ATPase subunit b
LVNFAILAGALGYGISKKAGAFFGSRNRAIQEGIAEAARFRGEAEARAAEVDRRLSKLASDIEELRRNAREEMAAEGERIRLETERGLRKIQAQAEQEIVSAGKAARQELKAYSAQLALDAARHKIRSRLTPAIEDSLVRSFVDELEQHSDQRSGRGQG